MGRHPRLRLHLTRRWRFAVVAAFFALLAVLVVLGELPALVVGFYAALSGVAFLVYRADKQAALEGRWRTSEQTLHLLALVGGWPGALLARRFLRHKTVKQPFRAVFWVTVLANGAALAWLTHAGLPLGA